MRNAFHSIAELRIKEAMKKGELKNLPGEGKPVEIKDMTLVPEEERAMAILMKNLGIVPDEVALRKEIEELQEKIEAAPNQELKEKLIKEQQEKNIRFNILMEKRRMK